MMRKRHSAEIVLEYHHDPMYENIEKVHLVAEFVKTEDGWRLSGGDYYDYLFGGRNPSLKTHKQTITHILLLWFL